MLACLSVCLHAYYTLRSLPVSLEGRGCLLACFAMLCLPHCPLAPPCRPGLLSRLLPAGRVAGFIHETIQGVGGAMALADGYLPAAYKVSGLAGGSTSCCGSSTI